MMTLWSIGLAVLAILMLLALVRLVKGPTVPDRVVAMDAVNTLVVASMILMAARYRQPIFVDVAIVYALLSFVGLLYVARYLGREL